MKKHAIPFICAVFLLLHLRYANAVPSQAWVKLEGRYWHYIDYHYEFKHIVLTSLKFNASTSTKSEVRSGNVYASTRTLHQRNNNLILISPEP